MTHKQTTAKAGKASRANRAAKAKTGTAMRAANRAANDDLGRRLFVTILLVLTVVFGLAIVPILLNNAAKESLARLDAINDRIEARLNEAQELELKRATLLSSGRIERIAVNDLHMVHETAAQMTVELPSAQAAADSAQLADATSATAATATVPTTQVAALPTDTTVPTVDDTAAWVRILAGLTAGEASTLLVGDVGLAGMNQIGQSR
ncbi:MAG: hypothetical protein LBS17_06515 [Actinomycetes bacterium]|jgi:cell division protein FtsL|nr:hypothetical protein [Actinomycetes bacterium]